MRSDLDTSQLLEKLIPSALVAFFVSVVWGAIHEGSKARRGFVLGTANELKNLLSKATKGGREYWLSSSLDRSVERFDLVAKQAEIVGLISLLEQFGYDPGVTREKFCDALTGGNFDTDGQGDLNAAANLNSAAMELRISVDSFTIMMIKRPILRLLTFPFRLVPYWWNRLLN